MGDLKFCKDCKHMRPSRAGKSYAYCDRPRLASFDLVWGDRAIPLPVLCADERVSALGCGRSGSLFEAISS